MTSRPLVLDTNVVLDLLLFADAATQLLKERLDNGGLRWIATQPMRDELECVLGYPQLQQRLAQSRLQAADVLAQFDRQAHIVEPAVAACVKCTDRADQKFIDLAVAHRCLLLSKDAAVLKTRKRLAALDIEVAQALPSSSYSLSES